MTLSLIQTKLFYLLIHNFKNKDAFKVKFDIRIVNFDYQLAYTTLQLLFDLTSYWYL